MGLEAGVTHRDLKALEAQKAEYAAQFSWTLALVFLDSSSRRLAKALEKNRDICKDHGKDKAAQCFDAALEATEEALEEFQK
jgi:hypothetical protein